MPELLPEECDCEDLDVDILTGETWCHQCGSRRIMSSEELGRWLDLEAEHHAYYDQLNQEMAEQIDEEATHDLHDEEIPF